MPLIEWCWEANSRASVGCVTIWVYFAALRRKGKDEGLPDAQKGDVSDLSSIMENVVIAHNTLNEMTWKAIQRWESLHPQTCDKVKLNRFIGRPNDMSPLAWIRQVLGGPTPFDRHDWYVLRDGEEVRYVIDFYFDDTKAGSSEVRVGYDDLPHCAQALYT